jgi:hypothetical protein
MTPADDPNEIGSLAHRLRTFQPPDTHLVLARALRMSDAPRAGGRRLRLRRPLVVAAALLATLAAGPVAQAAAPLVVRIPAGILARAGFLPGDAARVQVQPGTVTRVESGGRSLTLTGAFGDGDRTVVLLHMEPSFLPGNPFLTDEHGRVFAETGGTGGGLPAAEDMVYYFEPLPPGGHHLTLGWRPAPTPHPMDGANPPPGMVPAPGDWTMRFPLSVHPSVLGTATPSSGSAGAVGIAITTVRAGDYSIHVHVRATGVTDTSEGGGIQLSLLDASGRSLEDIAGTGSGQLPSSVDLDHYWRSPGPGVYRLVVTSDGRTFESQITLPGRGR